MPPPPADPVLDDPIAMEAPWSFVNPDPFAYSNTRLFCSSTTQRLPEESKAAATGPLRLVAPDPGVVPEEGLVCPIASEAAWSLEKANVARG